jgi:hypothetical protein
MRAPTLRGLEECPVFAHVRNPEARGCSSGRAVDLFSLPSKVRRRGLAGFECLERPFGNSPLLRPRQALSAEYLLSKIAANRLLVELQNLGHFLRCVHLLASVHERYVTQTNVMNNLILTRILLTCNESKRIITKDNELQQEVSRCPQ